jgi:hypothetical protein
VGSGEWGQPQTRTGKIDVLFFYEYMYIIVYRKDHREFSVPYSGNEFKQTNDETVFVAED